MPRLSPFFLEADKYKRIIDYHVHSDYNEDATGTIEECVCSALKKKLTSVAITNHVWKTSSWIENFISKAKICRSKYDSHLLIGFEAKIININGELDISPQYIKETELLLGSLHRLPTQDDYAWLQSESIHPLKAAEIVRDATLNLISRNEVHVIAHPLAFYYQNYKASFPNDFLNEIVLSASKRGIALEIYNSKYPLPEAVFRKLIHLCIQYKVPMSIGSNAHNPSEIGNIDYEGIQIAIELAAKSLN